MLTNKPLAATRAILDGLDLARFFLADRVLGGDGPHPRKPDPAGLRHALRPSPAWQPAATLMVGDSIVDWRTARAAGTRAAWPATGSGSKDFRVE